jgi:lipid kinase YegS
MGTGFALSWDPRRYHVTRTMTVVVRPPAEPGRIEELRLAVAAVRQRGHRVRVRVTFEPGDARRYARAAALGGCDVVVAAGGDGTINEVVNGLTAASSVGGAAIGRGPALALLPLGTANDFAGGLGLPTTPAEALLLAAEGEARLLDVARVNRRCFINVSTGGFGAASSRRASRRVKRWLGRLTYVVTGARLLARYEPVRGVFRSGGRVLHEGGFVFFAVGNARHTGGGTPITPLADHGDGKLDLVVVHGTSRMDFLALLPELRAGTHVGNPDVSYFRADAFEVEVDEAIQVNADGEPVAGQRFRYDLLAGPLPVVLPPRRQQQRG